MGLGSAGVNREGNKRIRKSEGEGQIEMTARRCWSKKEKELRKDRRVANGRVVVREGRRGRVVVKGEREGRASTSGWAAREQMIGRNQPCVSLAWAIL